MYSLVMTASVLIYMLILCGNQAISTGRTFYQAG